MRRWLEPKAPDARYNALVLVPLVTVLGVLAPSGAPAPRPGDGPPDLVAKAYAAAEELRYCDAVPLFLALHERAGSAQASPRSPRAISCSSCLILPATDRAFSKVG